MKRIMRILSCLMMIFAMIGCSHADDSSLNYPESGISKYSEIPSGPYAKRTADWPIYQDAHELVDHADMVLIGRVKSIEFQVLDLTNALPISEETPDHAKELYTIYHMDVLTTYQGNVTNEISVRVMGGMVGYETDQQLAMMEDHHAFNRERGIPIWDQYSKVQCEVGKTYLFVLSQFETGLPTIVNLEQSVYDLEEPTRKNTIGENSAVYYSGNADEYGNPLISALDIVDSFGDECTKSFEKNWMDHLYK